MRKAILSIAVLALVAIGVGLVAPSAQASCGATIFVTNNGYSAAGGRYTNIEFPFNTPSNPGTFVGRFWQTDAPATNNEGTFDVGVSMFDAPYGSPDDWAFLFDLSGAGINGCPVGCLTLYIEDPSSGHAILWTRPQGSTYSTAQFDYTYGDYATTVAPQGPRPRVTSSSRAGAIVNVNFDIPDVNASVRTEASPDCGGVDGSVTSRGVYIQQSATAPSTSLPGSWTLLGGTAPGAGPVDARGHGFDCTNTALDWWMATGISVSGQAPRFVSSPVQVECDPNLANPTGGFKKIDRPAPAPRTEGRD